VFLVILVIKLLIFLLLFSDNALPGYSGGGRPSRGGKERDGRNPPVCFDRQTPAKTDMERQVTQRATNFSPVAR